MTQTETPEETYARCCQDFSKSGRHANNLDLCEHYRKERNRMLAPTDEDIKQEFPATTGNGRMLEYNMSRQEGAEWMRKYFTE